MPKDSRWDFSYAAHEPDFDRDFEEGGRGELVVHRILGARGRHVEVKTKGRIDLSFYVETEHDPGRRGTYVPSGISTTEAETWAWVFGKTGIVLLVPAGLLRIAMNHPRSEPREETDGSCPTRGVLVPLEALFQSARPEPAAALAIERGQGALPL